MGWTKRILTPAGGLALAAGVALLAAAGLAWRAYRQDPLPRIDLGLHHLQRIEGRAYPQRTASGEARTYHDLGFEGAVGGPLRLTVSLPAETAEPLPVLVILGGLEVGRDSLKYVETHGRNALVAVQYPHSPTYWYEGLPLLRLPVIRAAVLAVPSRTVAVLAWIRAQPWADPERISLLGYSFGAVFVPAGARLAERHGQPLHSLVMAYSGAGLADLLEANARFRPAALRRPAAWFAGALLHPVEPALHLPHLRRPALFVRGLRDERVPLPAARRMQALHGGPRTVLALDAPHMDPTRPGLTREIVQRSQAWLVAQGAANP